MYSRPKLQLKKKAPIILTKKQGNHPDNGTESLVVPVNNTLGEQDKMTISEQDPKSINDDDKAPVVEENKEDVEQIKVENNQGENIIELSDDNVTQDLSKKEDVDQQEEVSISINTDNINDKTPNKPAGKITLKKKPPQNEIIQEYQVIKEVEKATSVDNMRHIRMGSQFYWFSSNGKVYNDDLELVGQKKPNNKIKWLKS